MSDTIVSRFQQAADRNGDENIWYEFTGGSWQPTRWAAARAWVEEIAAGLMAIGLARGDRVGLVGANRPEWVASDYGIQHAGAVPVPLYSTFSPEQIGYVLGHSGARVLIVDSQQQLDRALASDIPAVERIVAHHLGDADRGRVIGTDHLRELGRAWAASNVGALGERIAGVTPSDIFSIIYTSGTTGPPKGTVLTHGNIVWTIDTTVQRLKLNHPVETTVSYLPLSHVFERLVTTSAGLTGAGNRFEFYFVPELPMLPDALKAARPTVFVGVPRVWEKFEARIRAEVAETRPVQQKIFAWATRSGIEAARRRDEGGRSSPAIQAGAWAAKALVGKKVLGQLGLDRTTYAVSGAAPLAASVQRFFQSLGLPLHQGWGMTETSAACTVQPPATLHVGSVGPPLDGVELKLGDDGEVLVRGPNIFSGYFQEAEKTAEALSPEGWLSTGDIGKLGDDGSLYIVDRKKDIIITAGGKNIAPQEIESRLKADTLVAEAIVIGDQRPYLVALISLDADEVRAHLHHKGVETGDGDLSTHPGILEHVEAVVERVNEGFSRAEGIRRWAIVEGGFPAEALTPTMKLKRRVVKQACAEQIEALYR